MNFSAKAWSKKAARTWSPVLVILICAFLLQPLCAGRTAAASGDYFLYLPSSVDTEGAPLPDDGVLVKRIVLRGGDTLWGLSRHFTGKGHFYPQILLFNRITDPDRIYAGRELLVPVPRRVSHHPEVTRTSGRKPVGSGRSRHREAGQPPARGKDADLSGRTRYDEAFALFSKGRYREAIDAFSRFLQEYPHSPLAPDASLLRADSYLRLSEH